MYTLTAMNLDALVGTVSAVMSTEGPSSLPAFRPLMSLSSSSPPVASSVRSSMGDAMSAGMNTYVKVSLVGTAGEAADISSLRERDPRYFLSTVAHHDDKDGFRLPLPLGPFRSLCLPRSLHRPLPGGAVGSKRRH